jgi:hypothetical protein
MAGSFRYYRPSTSPRSTPRNLAEGDLSRLNNSCGWLLLAVGDRRCGINKLLELSADTTRQQWRIIVVIAAIDVAHQISFDEAASFQIELVIEKFCPTNEIVKLIDLN